MRAPAFKLWTLEGVPVFVYHGMSEDLESHAPAREKKFWVPQAQFHEELSHIRSMGFSTALLKEMWSPAVPANGSGSKVIITFDDGLVSAHRVAFPTLQEVGARAEFFLNTSTIGKEGYLSWQQIEEMQKWGMSFQSHSHDHVDLTRSSGEELERQLKVSKEALEDQLGVPVNFLAAPFGALNSTVVDCALRLGYQAVCSTRALPARLGARNLNRMVIYRGTSIRAYEQLLKCRPWGYLGRIAQSPIYRARSVLMKLRPMRPSAQVPEKRA